MITTPEDPIDVWINRVHTFALTLMDEVPIISVGMTTPNEIVRLRLYYESLESEPTTWIAWQLSRLVERTRKQLLPWLVSQSLNELTRRYRSASSRMTYPALRKRGR